MFRRLFTAGALLMAATIPMVAQESALYVDFGGEFVAADYLGLDLEIPTANARVGYDFNRHFGIEGQVSVGIDEYSQDFGTLGTAEASIDQTAGIFLRGKIPVSNTVEVFSKLGYVSTEISIEDTVNAVTTDYDFSQEGLAFGIGVTWLLRGNTGVRVDYTRYNYDVEDVVDVNADGLSIALYHRF